MRAAAFSPISPIMTHTAVNTIQRRQSKRKQDIAKQVQPELIIKDKILGQTQSINLLGSFSGIVHQSTPIRFLREGAF